MVPPIAEDGARIPPQSPLPSHSHSPTSPPPKHLVHGALLLAQIFFGLGSVVGSLGLPSMNPLAFALFREISAGALLLGAALFQSGREPDPKRRTDALAWLRHRRNFAMLGLVIFGNQAGYIVGIKMAGAVPASVWQPAQPVMVAAICMARGWERADRRRIAGVTVAFLSCAAMVTLSVKHKAGAGGGDGSVAVDAMADLEGGGSVSFRHLVGNLCFFVNCLSCSLYIILSKRVLNLYPPLYVTAWTYNLASAFMFIGSLFAAASSGFTKFLCPECTDGPFHIPPGAVPALVYYIVFTSAGSYSLMTWANRYVTGTLVMGYSVLQPVTAAALTWWLITAGIYPSCRAAAASAQGEGGAGDDAAPSRCLGPPGVGTLVGMVGVFAGLALVVMTEPGGDDKRGAYAPVKTDEEAMVVSGGADVSGGTETELVPTAAS